MRLGAEAPGSNGTPGNYQIMDNTASVVINMIMKALNSNPYTVTIGPTTGDPDMGEIVLKNGGAPLETLTFDISTGQDQIANLITAAAASAYYTLTLVNNTGNPLQTVTDTPVTPGTDPVYSRGVYFIQDTALANVLQLTLLHPGSKQFLLTIRPTLVDPNRTELLIIDGVTTMERFSFDTPTGTDYVTALMDAVARQGSNYFQLTKLADSVNPLAIIDQVPIPPGLDPVLNVAAYSNAFEVLEAFRWNVLSIDTNDLPVQMLMQMYLNRVYQGGKFVMGVIGQPATGPDAVPFDLRLQQASAFNDYQIVYVGNGFVDLAGTVYEGWLAAARIAGMIAGTPSNESITHLAVTSAMTLTEPLTNYYYERAILAGMLTFSTSAANTVWVESGINSLVLLNSREDAGWKKIKRVKVRFELFQRLNDTVEPLVGRLNNDPDGRMTVIQLGNGVCNAMVAERKLLAGAYTENDPNNLPKGDSAWFRVFADDIDALEKMYFTFMFRYAPDEV
jgi:hypothetical protein